MSKATIKKKRSGTGLSMQTFRGKQDGCSYLVFRTGDGSFHTFVETDAKEAAEDCGATIGTNTRQLWSSLWNLPAA